MAAVRNQGFSIPELIIALVVLGIISAVAMSRFMRSDSYNVAIARDQAISMARSAQQKAIGRSDVILTIQPVGGEIEFRISDSGGEVESDRIALATVGLTADTNELDSCAVTAGTYAVSNATPLVLNYDSFGDIVSAGVVGSPGHPADITEGVRLCINNNPIMSVCWSPSGFAYVGDCIP